MSSSQNLLADITEDISVPTLSNRFRLLVLPHGLRRMATSKTYRTRGSLAGGNIGKLKGFVDLPMDIAFETAMYLSPKDLLQLSRLSKQFRSIFASRSSIVVWRTVFRNLNMTCPPELNELQFTSLVYDKYCMACGRMMKCQIFPILHLRLCSSCQIANLIPIKNLENQYENAKDLICFLPASLGQCFKPEAQLLIEKFLSLKNENSPPKFIVNVGQHTTVRREGTVSILYLLNPRGRTGCRSHRGRTTWSCTKGVRPPW